MDEADPHLDKDLTDEELSRLRKSESVDEEPHLAVPYRLRELELRTKLRITALRFSSAAPWVR